MVLGGVEAAELGGGVHRSRRKGGPRIEKVAGARPVDEEQELHGLDVLPQLPHPRVKGKICGHLPLPDLGWSRRSLVGKN